MRGGEGGALFLVMQVLEIPAGGRGLPLVCLMKQSQNISNSNGFKYDLLLNVLYHQ